MKLYIWHRIEKLTNNCHQGGGLVIVAVDLEAARAALRATANEESHSRPPEDCEAFTKEPDRQLEVGHGEAPAIYTFPDSGCC